MVVRVGLHEAPWSFMEVSMDVRGGSMEVSIEVRGGPWRSVEAPWRFMEPPQTSTEPSWRSVELHGGLHVWSSHIAEYGSSG